MVTMKKRNVRKIEIFVLILLIGLFVYSLAIAGPGSKILPKQKSTPEKNISDDKKDDKEKDDSKTVSKKSVKEITVKNNNTKVEEKIQPVEKKKINVINFPNKVKPETADPVIQPEKHKTDPSAENVTIPSSYKKFDYLRSSLKTNENKIGTEKSVEPGKYLIHHNTASDNEIIRNQLKDHTPGTGPEIGRAHV